MLCFVYVFFIWRKRRARVLGVFRECVSVCMSRVKEMRTVSRANYTLLLCQFSARGDRASFVPFCRYCVIMLVVYCLSKLNFFSP